LQLTLAPSIDVQRKNSLGEGVCLNVNNTEVTSKDGVVYNQPTFDIDATVCQKDINKCIPNTAVGIHKCSDITPGKNVDGEACDNAAKCFSGTCNNGVCKGFDDKNACDHDGDCKVGSYCTGRNRTLPDSLCAPQIALGEACTTSTMCPNNADCYNGLCTALFSIASNDALAPLASAHMCQSYFAKDGFCTDYHYLGPKGDYKTNDADSKCTYNYTRININETAESDCAYDGSFPQNHYCSRLGTNSDLWQERLKKFKDYYNGPATKRHTVRRSAMPSDLLRLNVIVERWPHLYGSDKCAIDLFAGPTSNGAMVKISVFLLGLSFFLF